jgi:hypothetical protein
MCGRNKTKEYNKIAKSRYQRAKEEIRVEPLTLLSALCSLKKRFYPPLNINSAKQKREIKNEDKKNVALYSDIHNDGCRVR